jgi:hypothetical protein
MAARETACFAGSFVSLLGENFLASATRPDGDIGLHLSVAEIGYSRKAGVAL